VFFYPIGETKKKYKTNDEEFGEQIPSLNENIETHRKLKK
jgi:hypothetical protein